MELHGLFLQSQDIGSPSCRCGIQSKVFSSKICLFCTPCSSPAFHHVCSQLSHPFQNSICVVLFVVPELIIVVFPVHLCSVLWALLGPSTTLGAASCILYTAGYFEYYFLFKGTIQCDSLWNCNQAFLLSTKCIFHFWHRKLCAVVLAIPKYSSILFSVKACSRLSAPLRLMFSPMPGLRLPSSSF